MTTRALYAPPDVAEAYAHHVRTHVAEAGALPRYWMFDAVGSAAALAAVMQIPVLNVIRHMPRYLLFRDSAEVQAVLRELRLGYRVVAWPEPVDGVPRKHQSKPPWPEIGMGLLQYLHSDGRWKSERWAAVATVDKQWMVYDANVGAVLAGSGHFTKKGPRRARTSEPISGHFGPNPASTVGAWATKAEWERALPSRWRWHHMIDMAQSDPLPLEAP